MPGATDAPRAKLLFACFDEVPSFKGASSHVLAECRTLRRHFDVELHSLGRIELPAHRGFRHRPIALAEPNYLRRGERFRAHLGEQLARARPHLAHFRSPWEGLAVIRAGVPSVYEVNGLPSLELPQHSAASARTLSLLARDEHECLHGAQAVVCPSAVIARCVAQRYGVAESKIQVVANGYDLARPCADPGPCAPLRAVYLGTLHPWQGLHLLWPALQALEGRVELDLIGPAHRDFSPHLERVLQRRGLQRWVRWRGPMHRAALAHTLPGYHLGVAPLTRSPRNTEQGCCPLKILDYLSHGLPVLASDLPVVQALLRDGHNARLVRADDAAALRCALQELLAAPAQLAALRAQAQPSLRALPDWDAHGAQVAALHRGLLKSSETADSNRSRS